MHITSVLACQGCWLKPPFNWAIIKGADSDQQPGSDLTPELVHSLSGLSHWRY